jgi:2-amino-4-hydroxy-6-hydroxymethyldihydropteridine diphosphokinase
MASAFLSFGSSLGDRQSYFSQAKDLLEQFGVQVVRWSSLYETEPFYYDERDKDQPWYWNAVLEVETEHSAQSLLLLCHEVESRLGRSTRSEMEEGVKRYFPRTIDVDVLLYEDQVLDTELITVPHPRFHERRFSLVPLVDLIPDQVHPILGKTMAQLLQECIDDSVIKRLDIDTAAL